MCFYLMLKRLINRPHKSHQIYCMILQDFRGQAILCHCFFFGAATPKVESYDMFLRLLSLQLAYMC